ncbi:hypothetical protein [Marinomonas algarum]|uniref:Dual specificity protein phosphatase family protein n=1 Tax=Marinomonas algarum TaxID=2883105 RepID=A0A9X1RW52_9GAMM|nr:hypothetical protein [Marinomonas algarum]MCB5163162.1 hypothetical protein [Marinomonas algarum]
MKKVFFISQSEAEKLSPVEGAAIVSIVDPDKQPANLGAWEHIHRDSFYDGGYSEGTIRTMKSAFRKNYSSYIDSSQAERLSAFLDGLVASGANQIFVHCYYGESRSGAVAMYLRDKHGFTPNKPIEKPNRTVYDLLCNPTKFELLIQSYEVQDVDKKTPFHLKLWSLLLVAVGIKK